MDGEVDVEQKRKERRVTLVVFGVLGVAIAILAWSATLPGGGSSPGDSREAVAQCEGFADKRLKAPATADYNLSATESDGAWRVVGTVDSENSFGAKVRSDVRCVMHFTSDQAVLDDISVG